MTLSRKIADAVESLPPGGSLPSLIEAEAGSSRLALNLTTHGAVGLAFDGLDYAVTDRTELSAETLRSWGSRLAARLTYLMEPLVLLEVDAQAGEAALRSQTPTPRGDRRSFYEVRLRRDASLHLQRVAFDETTRLRQVVPCQMTREVLERLTDDLVASLL
jgi:hypothetical protein